MYSEPEILTVKTSRFEMDYIKFGSGKKYFVIIPGISLKPITDAAGAIAAAYAPLTSEYTVFVFDRKKDIEAGYDTSDMAADTAEAMKLLGIRDADIFGASQGGMIGMLLAIDYPELVHKLIICSAIARQDSVSESTMRKWITLANAGDRVALNRNMFSKIYSKDYLDKYSDVFSVMEKCGSPQELKRLTVLMEACISFDCHSELHKITCPVMVFGSMQDQVFTVDSLLDVSNTLNCPVYIYDGYSHAVYDEAPDFLSRLTEFL